MRTPNIVPQKVTLGVLIAVTLVASYRWVISPHMAYLQAVQRYEPAVTDMAVCTNTAREGLAAKRRQLYATTAELETLWRKFFTSAQAATFLGDLWILAENAGCTATSVDFLLDEDRLRKDSLPDQQIAATHRAKLALWGGYDDVVQLLEQVQHRSQTVSIDSCHIELPDGCANEVKCELVIAIWVIAAERANE